MDLRQAFGPGNVVSVVGAGGKKSTLYALAAALDSAVVTATVRIPLFDGQVSELHVAADPERVVRTVDTRPLGIVPERDGDRNRYLGYDLESIDALAASTDDTILIKADGARTRLFKAPDDDEPRVPDSTDLLVPVASVQAVGKPLNPEHVHRPERVAALTDLSLGDPIRSDDLVTVLTHDEGGLKGRPEGARVVSLINMVDNEGLEATARPIASELCASSRVDRVVLGRMDRGRVVDIVE